MDDAAIPAEGAEAEVGPADPAPPPIGGAAPEAGGFRESTIPPEPRRASEPTIVDLDFSGVVDAEAATIGDGPPPRAVVRKAAPQVPGFEVYGELGRGGMGVVYLARRTLLNRKCALKMILAGEHAGPEAAVRFLAEAEAVARLDHPNVIRIYAVGEHDGAPFLELEFAESGSLEQRLDGRPWPARDASALVEALARGVAEAHRLGIVHRDLKPANVLLTRDGVPKVTDFGLARSLGVDSGLTLAESIIGSPSYMAPEQAFGRAREAGPRADVYSLGAILYELLTGRPPFVGTTMYETLEQVRKLDPVRPGRLVPGLPGDLEAIVLECLHKEPARRFASAEELAADLRRFLDGQPVRARRIGDFEWLWRWSRRHKVFAAWMATMIVGMLGATAASLWVAYRANQEMAAAQRASADHPAPRAPEARAGTAGAPAVLLRVVLGDDLTDLVEDLDARRRPGSARPLPPVRPIPGPRVLPGLAEMFLRMLRAGGDGTAKAGAGMTPEPLDE